MLFSVVMLYLWCSTAYSTEFDRIKVPFFSEKLSITAHNIVKKESFSEWKQWAEKYPNCDPKTNPYTSPIRIVSADIVPAPDLEEIYVHSKLPVDDCLTLSILYKDGYLEMEAVTLTPFPACSKQLTYISEGLDEPLNLRYFKRAVFFFAKNEPEEERSMHQLKGKKFQMEILLEFEASTTNDITQAFVLVEVSSPETTPANPIFTALESAFTEITEEIANESSGKTERAKKYKQLENTCSSTEAKYLQAYEEAKAIFDTDRIQNIKTIIRNIKGITNKDLENLIDKNESEKMSNKTRSRSIMEQKIDKLRIQRTTLFEMLQEEEEQWAINKLEDLYEKVDYGIKRIERLENESSEILENMKEILKANKVGMPGEKNSLSDMLYEDPDAVHKDLLETQSKINECTEYAKLYNKSCQKFMMLQKEPYAFVRIKEPFQISWLFPHSGGYFLYDGSSPIPECKRRDTTIVFEEPIFISSEQLSIFQNLPSLGNPLQKGGEVFYNNDNQTASQNNVMDGKLTLDDMISIPYDTGNSRKIWYVAKNTVFLNDDGFHKKSPPVIRWHASNKVASADIISGSTVELKHSHFLYFVTLQILASIVI